MHESINPAANEKGSVIVIGMIVLVMLTLFGMSAITTSNIESQISVNERHHKQAFYVAESGWHLAAGWLNNQFPLPVENLGLDRSTVSGRPRYFSTSNASFSANQPFNVNNTYQWPLGGGRWMETKIEFLGATQPPGYGEGFFRFVYEITSTGRGPRNTQTEVTVGVGRIDQTGT